MYLLIHPSRPEAVTTDNTAITRWSLRDGTPTMLAQIPCMRGAWCSAVAPEGEYFALAIAAPRESIKPKEPTLVTNENGETFRVITSGFGGGVSAPCEIEIRYWHDLSLAQTLPVPESGINITSMCFSPDGRWLVAADFFEHIHLIDRQTGQVVHKIYGSECTTGLVFDPTSTYLAIGRTFQGGGDLGLYKLENGKIHEVLEDYAPDIDLSDTFFQIAFSPDSATLATYTSRYEAIQVYDVQSGQRKWSINLETSLTDGSRLKAEWDFCSVIYFTPDGRQIISGDGTSDLLCFDTNDGRLLRRLPTGSRQPVTGFALEPSGEAAWAIVRDGEDFETSVPRLQRIPLAE